MCGETNYYELFDDGDNTVFIVKYKDEKYGECYKLKIRDGNYKFMEIDMFLCHIWEIGKNLNKFLSTIPSDPYPDE